MGHGVRRALVALALPLAILCGRVSPVPAQTWFQMSSPSTNIGPIACSADGADLILGDGTWLDYFGGVPYVSHDSGATWVPADLPVGSWVGLASSADGTTLLATGVYDAIGPAGLYISKDSGATWRQNEMTNLTGGIACSADGTRLFAAAAAGMTNGSPAAVYASVDSGATWAMTGAPSAPWGSLACSADGTTVVAGEGADVWVSTNSGASFRLACTLVPPYLSPGDGATGAGLACSADATTIAASVSTGGSYGNIGVATSRDSGATWRWGSSRAPTNAVAAALWRFVCCSADGSRMATVGYSTVAPAGGLPFHYLLLSSNSGASWALAPPLPQTNGLPLGLPLGPPACAGLAISADGCKLAAAYVGVEAAYLFNAAVANLQATQAPRLGITTSGGGLALSWTVPSISFTLQQSPSLATTNWTEVPSAPVLDYSTLANRVTIPAPARTMFYRLISR